MPFRAHLLDESELYRPCEKFIDTTGSHAHFRFKRSLRPSGFGLGSDENGLEESPTPNTPEWPIAE